MTDHSDLKAIAEACQQHQPLRFMRSHGALYIRNDNGIVFDVHQNRSFPEFMAQNKDYADLVLAATPATILALIAENEALRREREGKVLCGLELFQNLRDTASQEAEEHRQHMAVYRPRRQEVLDHTVRQCDVLIGAAMGQGEQS